MPGQNKNIFSSHMAQTEFEVATLQTQDQSIHMEKKWAEFRTENLGNGITLDLMVIPGGSFLMGAPDSEDKYEGDEEVPQHQVSVNPFLMGKYPVTEAQWKAVAALPKVACELEVDSLIWQGDHHPVERISWQAAVEFCDRLNHFTATHRPIDTVQKYRLPSEAEWEYACRANTTTPFHFGETLTSDLANYDANYWYGNGSKGHYRDRSTAVGRFPANAFGLYDMHGNVWEWCLDHWHETYAGAPTDGSAWVVDGDSSLRVARGGCWYNPPDYCRSAARSRDNSLDYGVRGVGFRVVASLPRQKLILLEKEHGAASPRTLELPAFQGDGTYSGIDINSNASLRDRMDLSE